MQIYVNKRFYYKGMKSKKFNLGLSRKQSSGIIQRSIH
jgi:hypothetical protein